MTVVIHKSLSSGRHSGVSIVSFVDSLLLGSMIIIGGYLRGACTCRNDWLTESVSKLFSYHWVSKCRRIGRSFSIHPVVCSTVHNWEMHTASLVPRPLSVFPHCTLKNGSNWWHMNAVSPGSNLHVVHGSEFVSWLTCCDFVTYLNLLIVEGKIQQQSGINESHQRLCIWPHGWDGQVLSYPRSSRFSHELCKAGSGLGMRPWDWYMYVTS